MITRSRSGTRVPPGGLITIMVPVPLSFPADWTLPKEFSGNVIGGQVISPALSCTCSGNFPGTLLHVFR